MLATSLVRAALLSACALVLAGACSQGAKDEADAQAPGFQCCVLQNICKNCICDDSVEKIGESRNETACESFLDDQDDYGCDSSTTNGRRYREAEAIADCA